jgi:hypothetical protein
MVSTLVQKQAILTKVPDLFPTSSRKCRGSTSKRPSCHLSWSYSICPSWIIPPSYALKCYISWRIESSGMWRRIALVRIDVSEESFASIIRVQRNSQLGTKLAVAETSNDWADIRLRIVRSYRSHTALHPRRRDTLHRHRPKNLKSYIALTGWTLYWRCNVSPVKYELGFYIPQDDILHSHRREHLKSYIALTCWTL